MKRSLLAAACAVMSACTGQAPSTAPTPTVETGPLEVKVSSFPAEYLVKRLGGDAISLTNILPVGEDPPFWSPTGEQVAQMQSADLIVANGAGFEKWMQTATLPSGKVVDSAADVKLVHLKATTHSHGKEGEHSHAGIDPHTWSDPVVYLQQAEVVHAALVKARPSQAATFDAGLASLRTDLTALDAELKAALAHAGDKQLSANHPAFNYIARRYGLQIRSFDFDPEEVPSAESIAGFDTWAAEVPEPRMLWWESQADDVVKRAFAAGTIHVHVDPLEQPAADGAAYDYVAQAKANAQTFRSLFPAPAPEEAPE